MTFGKVNEMGQFIREAEPEPDVKKSKGMDHQTLSFLPHHFICPHCVLLELTSRSSEKSRLRGATTNLVERLPASSVQPKAL